MIRPAPRLAFLLLAGLALPCIARANEVESLDKGDAEQALRSLAGPEGQPKRPTQALLVCGAIRRYLDGKGVRDPDRSRKLAEAAAGFGKAIAEENPEDVACVLVGAEGALLVARQKVIAKDPAWVDAWRSAARGLTGFAGTGASWAKVRAVEMLSEAALQPGAPAAELLEEARGAASGDIAAGFAHRLGLARYELGIRKRKPEAEAALEPFVALRADLEKNIADVDLATLFNDAAEFARRNKLAVKLEFLTDRTDTASLHLALPRSHRWQLEDSSQFGAKILQLTPEGFCRREITIINLPPDTPGQTDLRSSNTVRASKFFDTACKPIAKVKRQRKPATASLGKLKGIGFEVAGWASNEHFQVRRGFLFNGKRLKDSFGTILSAAYGDDAENDADAEALFDSVRDE